MPRMGEILMRSISGHVTFKDGLVYGNPRKPYTRNHPYPENTFKHPPAKREKAAIVILRKKGNRIQHIAKFLGRSTSFVYRVLKRNRIPIKDMRKMPNQTRLRCSKIRWKKLQRFFLSWESWILGEGERPP